jgi:hypothetical protein
MNFLNRKRNILRRNNLLFALAIILISIGIHFYVQTDVSQHNKIRTQLKNQLAQNRSVTLPQNNHNSPTNKTNKKITILANVTELHSSMILPYREGYSSNSETTVNLDSLSSSLFRTPRTFTFNNLTQNVESSTTSSFICPHDLPFAISYQLESTAQRKILYGQVYKNACIGQPGGSANNDILYGENQNIDSFGKTEQMTAFKPINQPEGCHLAINNIQAPIKISESTTIVTPITTIVNNESITIGYKQTTNLNINCLQICNSMLNHLCAAGDSINISYCKQTITAAYQRSTTYYLRNIQQNFCACQVYSSLYGGYSFTNAVDIESAINYHNQLSSVTCSNIQQ